MIGILVAAILIYAGALGIPPLRQYIPYRTDEAIPEGATILGVVVFAIGIAMLFGWFGLRSRR